MTVSFNGLGNEGRLGNQMFQYAFMRGMSKKPVSYTHLTLPTKVTV